VVTDCVVVASHRWNNCTIPNFKRELKLMSNILILVCILICGGISYLVLVLWHATQKQSSPKSFYLLAMITILIVTAIKMVTLFCMNKEVKNITIKYLRKLTQFWLSNNSTWCIIYNVRMTHDELSTYGIN
jgi:ABC-type Fe3+-siderophore transport system permease subunit